MGVLVDINKPETFINNVNEMYGYKYNKASIKEVGLKYFDVKEGIKKYKKVYDKILFSHVKHI